MRQPGLFASRSRRLQQRPVGEVLRHPLKVGDVSHDSEPVYKLEFVDIPAKQLIIQWPRWTRDGNWRRGSGIGQEITALEIGAWAVGLTSCTRFWNIGPCSLQGDCARDEHWSRSRGDACILLDSASVSRFVVFLLSVLCSHVEVHSLRNVWTFHFMCRLGAVPLVR